MKPSDSLCLFPFSNIEQRTDGTYAPCCKWKGSLSLKNATPLEAFQSEEMNQIREKFRQNQTIVNCLECHAFEKSGGESMRLVGRKYFKVQESLDHFEKYKTPKKIELRLGNTCNMSCRICNPSSSSLWVTELTRQGLITQENKEEFEQYKGRDFFSLPHAREDFLKLLPGLTEIQFTGGEPLLNKEHELLLQELEKNNVLSRLILRYNTNGSLLPKETLRLWEKAREVHLNFSVDDIGMRFNYERYGVDFNRVHENLKQIRDLSRSHPHIIPNLFVTVSCFNFFYLDDYFRFFNGLMPVTLSLLSFPAHFNVRALPSPLKKMITEKFKGVAEVKDIITYMNAEDWYEEQKQSFHANIKRSDLYRNQNFSDFFPELSVHYF